MWRYLIDTWVAVYPNLIASAITGGAAYVWARGPLKRLAQSHRDLHDKIDRLHQQAGSPDMEGNSDEHDARL